MATMRPQTKIAALAASLATTLALGVGAIAFGGTAPTDKVEIHQVSATEAAPTEAPVSDATPVAEEAPAPTTATASPAAPLEGRVTNLESRTSTLEQAQKPTPAPEGQQDAPAAPSVVSAPTTTTPTTTPITVPVRPCVIGRNCPGDAGAATGSID